MVRLKNSQFIFSCDNYRSLKEFDEPEICFIGRSNAGKSTLINRLTGRKHLSKVGQTPGLTKELLLFLLKFDEPVPDTILVDIPGYGFSARSKGVEAKLSRIILDYLQKRHINSKKKISFVLVQDIRRDFRDDEVYILEHCAMHSLELTVYLSKADKINQKEMHARHQYFNSVADDILNRFTETNLDTVCYVPSSVSLETVWETILRIENENLNPDC